jgi:lipoyl synthase
LVEQHNKHVTTLPRERLPKWLKVRRPWSEEYNRIHKLMRTLSLHTVCREARCPNIGECWNAGTATIMILGDTCTRACHFCAVTTGNPRGVVDLLEPIRVAEAVAQLQLKYVVITSVDRDDLPDGGASIFAETIRQLQRAAASVFIEVLTPDFRGDFNGVKTVVDAHSDIFGQNIETVRRLTPGIRDRRAGYEQTLNVLRTAKELDPSILTKSSIMLGLGEKPDEIIEAMQDLRNNGVDLIAIGQYLRPTDQKRHYPIAEYIHPDQFKYYERIAKEIGFLYCAAGPLVRSSYKAWEAEQLLKAQAAKHNNISSSLDRNL